jgi:hypothetical protein
MPFNPNLSGPDLLVRRKIDFGQKQRICSCERRWMLSPPALWKQCVFIDRRGHINQYDINITREPTMLKSVIEKNHVNLVGQFSSDGDAINANDDPQVRQDRFVPSGLVAESPWTSANGNLANSLLCRAMTTAGQPNTKAPRQKVSSKKRSDRGLSGPAH